MTRPIDPPPPPPPPGLQARVDAMSIHDIDHHLQRLMGLVIKVRGNPPVGQAAKIAALEGAFALLSQTATDRRASQAPAPAPGDVALASAVAQIQDIIAGTAQ